MGTQRPRILGTKAVAQRLRRRHQPEKTISDGRVRQYLDAAEKWAEMVAAEMGITADEVRRRLLARDPSIVEVEPGPDGEPRVVGLAGVAARIHADPHLRRKSEPGVKGGPLEYAVDFPLVGLRVVDLLRQLGVEPDGINAEREWTCSEDALALFLSVERRPAGNPRWAERRAASEQEGAAEE